MVRAPNQQAPAPAPTPSRTPPDRSAPILRVTAGSPDHKRLLEALRWLMSLPDDQGNRT